MLDSKRLNLRGSAARASRGTGYLTNYTYSTALTGHTVKSEYVSWRQSQNASVTSKSTLGQEQPMKMKLAAVSSMASCLTGPFAFCQSGLECHGVPPDILRSDDQGNRDSMYHIPYRKRARNGHVRDYGLVASSPYAKDCRKVLCK